MPGELPDDVGERDLPDGVVIVLPRRALGRLTAIPIIMVAVSAGLALGPAVALARSGGGGGSGPMPWIMLAIMLAGPLAMALIGLGALEGHTEIELRGGDLTAIERLRPLRWRRCRRGATVRRLRVHRASATLNGKPVRAGVLASMAALTAEYDGAKTMVLAAAYPESMLLAVANRLHEALGTQAPARLLDADDAEPVTVDVVDHGLPQAADGRGDEATPAPRPAGTRVTIDRNDDGITVTVPPAGVWKGSKGLFGGGILWTALVLMIGAAAARQSSGMPFVMVGLFGSFGVVMILSGVNMGLRHAVIDVVGDVLLVNRKHLFGYASHQWTRDELTSITVGPSGMEVNNRSVLHMKISPREGKPVGLFTGRDEAELRWIAGELRAAVWGARAASSVAQAAP